MREFEERLRQSLHTRAAAVRPDPARRAELARRIRRRRVVIYAVPATAAVAAVMVAAVVVPALIPSTTEVELDSADSGPQVVDDGEEDGGADATEPDEPEAPEEAAEPDEPGDSADATETAEQPGDPDGPEPDVLEPLDEVEGLRDRIPGLSILDGDTHHLVGKRAISERWAGSTVAGQPAVSPQSDAGEPLVAFLRVPDDGGIDGCEAELHVSGVAGTDSGSRENVVVESASCPGTPAISPSGQRVAWIDEGQRLVAVDVTEALGNDGSASSTSWELEAGGPLDLRGWLSSTDGWQLVVAETTDGADQLHLLQIERQADGELALPPDGHVLGDGTAVPRERLSPVSVGTIQPREPQASEVDLLGLDEGNMAFIRRGDLEHADGQDFPLDGDVGQALFDDDDLEPVTTAWVTSHGRDVLVGDGRGAVWHVLLPDGPGDAADVTELDAQWTGAAILRE